MHFSDDRGKTARLRSYQTLRNYIVAHWRGHLSLSRSFWLNLVALRVLIFLTQSSAFSQVPLPDVTLQWLIVTATIVFHGVVLLWQIVGVVRAAETDFAVRGNMALVWGAQLVAVLLFILSIIYSVEAMQIAMFSTRDENPFTLLEREHASQYSLTLSSTLDQLTINGSIELGITKAVTRLVNRYPTVSQVNLHSSGGNIYEARGLAGIFKDRQLNTHNEYSCASACTIAYVGGIIRTAMPNALFGFHQYRVDADYEILVTDANTEQQRDAALFTAAGVSDEFVLSMFDRVPNDMWWPGMDELLKAGFVHKLHVENQ